MIIAVDPGTTQSGFVVLDYAGQPVHADVLENPHMLEYIAETPRTELDDVLAIEMVASYGMPVGREVFETVRWIGRFQQAWQEPEKVKLVYRQEVKLHLCASVRAKDAHIWQALKDRFGEPGTKKNPGALYGVKSHARAALAVAVYVHDRRKGELQ